MQQQQQQQQRDPEVSLRIVVLPAPPRRTSGRPAGRPGGTGRHRRLLIVSERSRG